MSLLFPVKHKLSNYCRRLLNRQVWSNSASIYLMGIDNKLHSIGRLSQQRKIAMNNGRPKTKERRGRKKGIVLFLKAAWYRRGGGYSYQTSSLSSESSQSSICAGGTALDNCKRGSHHSREWMVSALQFWQERRDCLWEERQDW